MFNGGGGVWFRAERWESFLLEIFVYCAAFVVGRVIAIALDSLDLCLREQSVVRWGPAHLHTWVLGGRHF
jgi:hypothetical protein